MPLFCLCFPQDIQLKSCVFSILWNLVYSSIFLLWWKGFLYRLTHLDNSVCLHTSVVQCFMKQFSSWFLWGSLWLSSNQNRNDLCKKPNAMETPPKDNVCRKGSHPVFFCACFLNLTKGSRIQEWTSSLIPCLLSSLILSLSLKFSLSADQEVLQGSSWKISEQPLIIL